MSTNATGQASLNLWQHNALASDLARHLSSEGRMVWLDMQLGPQGSPRPDVYRIDKSFVRPCPTAYECKISRSDFLSDVTTGKWRSYLNYAYSVIFAVPEGLVKPSELPDMCGLIVRKDSGWRIAKRATVNPHPIAEHALLKLLIDGVEREGPGRRRQLYVEQYAGDRFAKKFGYEAARFVADAASIHTSDDSTSRGNAKASCECRGGQALISRRKCGTEGMYQMEKCRCLACKEAHRLYRAARRLAAAKEMNAERWMRMHKAA